MFFDSSTLRLSLTRVTLPPSRELCVQFRSALDSPEAIAAASVEEPPPPPSPPAQAADGDVIRIRVE